MVGWLFGFNASCEWMAAHKISIADSHSRESLPFIVKTASKSKRRDENTPEGKNSAPLSLRYLDWISGPGVTLYLVGASVDYSGIAELLLN